VVGAFGAVANAWNCAVGLGVGLVIAFAPDEWKTMNAKTQRKNGIKEKYARLMMSFFINVLFTCKD
jgi:hypothetical protein